MVLEKTEQGGIGVIDVTNGAIRLLVVAGHGGASIQVVVGGRVARERTHGAVVTIPGVYAFIAQVWTV
ncbi:hypothetical protein [Nocardioides mangrovicus]|uniref:hypothetical protein n=1 Tax=Nocardioides mangrovicus TaxID=2478913 RepID=UPI0018E08589|nr:hypothetical protein [Nocardioides mangrovicus]